MAHDPDSRSRGIHGPCSGVRLTMRYLDSPRASALAATLLAGTLAAHAATGPENAWPRWGGAQGDFRVSTALGVAWPKKGVDARWRAEVDGGHAAPVIDAERVYVVSGRGRAHQVDAFDRESGTPVWRHDSKTRYASHRPDWDGPHATPALVGDLLILVQIDGIVRAHDRSDGTVRWERDLVTEQRVSLPQSGWAASPLPYRDLVLLPGLGGRGPGAMAMRIADGSIAWTTGSFRSSHASPILIEPNARPVAVFHGMDELVGIEPGGGTPLWTRPLRSGAADNVSFTALWDATRRLLVVSHRFDDIGSQAFFFPAGVDTPNESPTWTQRRLQIEHGNGVIHGDLLIGSHRGTPGLLVAIDLATGEARWRARIPKATMLSVESPSGEADDRRLLVLDETGRLHLARADDAGFERIDSFQAMDGQSWTVPSLAGRDLVLRNGGEVGVYELP